MHLRNSIPVQRESVSGIEVTIQLRDFAGGHSGVEIDKGRANSNMIMGRMLCELAKETDYRLVSLEGGNRETSIAAATSATFVVESAGVDATSPTFPVIPSAIRML